MSERGRRASRADEVRAWGLWALWFVAGALVALAAVPAYLGQRVEDAQNRINEVLQPASNLSSRISLLSSRQMARFEGFVLSGGDPSFQRDYVGAIGEENQAYEQLRVLAGNLDLRVRERLAVLSAATAQWHLENQRAMDVGGPAERQATLVRSRETYATLQRGTELLDEVIQEEVRAGQAAMAEVRRLQARITLALALVALGATLVVAVVGIRLKGLTREANTRRRDAVRARREIDALLEATGDGVLGIDLQGRCLSLNRAGVQLLGYTEKDIRGKDFHDTLHHTRADGTPRSRDDSRVLRALETGGSSDSNGVDVLWRRDGTALPVKWAQRPLVDGIDLRGTVLTFTDMTEVERKEAALRKAIRQREDVVSIVSHDLRNPLGVVFGATDILLELPLEGEERRRQAEIIGRAARRMNNLIEDLLDVSRIEDGALVVRKAVESLPEILEEAAGLFHDQADRKGIRLSVDVRTPGIRARLDRDRLLQALQNLLDNAVRLTPEGGRVTLAAENLGEHVAVHVSDTGPGIAEEVLPHVFDRFWQEEGSKRGAAGLGLAIVKGVVDAHGGRVRVRSAVGVGTTFTLLFPAMGGESAREAGA